MLGGGESLEGTKSLTHFDRKISSSVRKSQNAKDAEKSYEGDAESHKTQRSQTTAVGIVLLRQKLRSPRAGRVAFQEVTLVRERKIQEAAEGSKDGVLRQGSGGWIRRKGTSDETQLWGRVSVTEVRGGTATQ